MRSSFFSTLTSSVQQLAQGALHTRDTFFALEVLGPLLRGSVCTANREHALIHIVRTVSVTRNQESPYAFAAQIPALMAACRSPHGAGVAVLLDAPLAAMLSGSVSLLRSDPLSEIRQAELENLIGHGLWKLSGSMRASAAEKLGIAEIQTCVADADVVQVRLDKHRVVSPVGFPARTVEFTCRQTFVDSKLLAALEAQLTDDTLVAVVEAPALMAGLVARTYPAADALVISVGGTETAAYRIQSGELHFIDSFGWGIQHLFAGIAREFALTEEFAHTLLERSLNQELSPAMQRAVQKAASGELALLSKGIAAMEPPRQVLPVYVHGQVPLPAFFFDPVFAKKLGLSIELTEVNSHFIGEAAGFGVQLPQVPSAASEYTFDAVQSAIAEVCGANESSVITKTAKQRARWAKNLPGNS
jgi:hypothetical protein